jgi:hypothetical protein
MNDSMTLNDSTIFNANFLKKYKKDIELIENGEDVLPSDVDFLKYRHIKELVEPLNAMASTYRPPTTVTPDEFEILKQLFDYNDDIINRTNLTNWCRMFLSRYFHSDNAKFLQIIDKEIGKQAEAKRVAEQMVEESKAKQEAERFNEARAEAREEARVVARRADALETPFFRFGGKSKPRRKSKSRRKNETSK